MAEAVKPTELSFETICKFLTACQGGRGQQKGARLRSLMDKTLMQGSDELYEVYRLILPHLDKNRGHYDLKEAKLVASLCKACSVDPKVNSAAKRAVDWRNPTTKNAGNFPAVMKTYLFDYHCSKPEGDRSLKIGQLNAKLDELVEAKGDAKVGVLRWLVTHTSSSQMRWILQIILKDMKIGISESTVFKNFHPDAEHLYNMCMDMKEVFVTLKDKKSRIKRKDVEPGRPARPQLASAVHSVEDAYKRMAGKTFVVETKFDGERMQLHREGDKIQYISRAAIDHGERSNYSLMDEAVKRQVRDGMCILDGELIVWNKLSCKFEPFGGIKSVFNAAKEARPKNETMDLRSEFMSSQPDYIVPTFGDIEVIYIAFDVLYCDNQSVINRTLLQRQELLRKLVRDAPPEGTRLGNSEIVGRVVALLPDQPFLSGTVCCKTSHSVEDIQEAFEDAVRLQEEGIVVKDLDSQWKTNDRGNSWLKLKPDYVHASDIDAVIIGGYYGTGRRAGDIAEYLLALAETPPPGHMPSRFLSFCRVGTGLDDKQRKWVADKLRPHYTKTMPSQYRVTGHSKERPDVWIRDPRDSIVLQITADVRTIVSRVFATKSSLRFPRVLHIREDKSYLDVQTQDDLFKLLDQNRSNGGGGRRQHKRKSGSKKSVVQTQMRVAAGFAAVNVSDVQKTSDILAGIGIEFLSYGSGRRSREELARLVAGLGGKVYQNPSAAVTHYLAQPDTDLARGKSKMRVLAGHDIASVDWLLECADAGILLPFRPKHYLHLSRRTRLNSSAMDRFGISHNAGLDLEDGLAVIKRHMMGDVIDQDALEAKIPVRPGQYLEDAVIEFVDAELEAIGNSPQSTRILHGCRVCILECPDPTASDDSAARVATAWGQPGEETFPELQALVTKRVALQVQLYGGKVSDSVEAGTTHLLVLYAPRGGMSPLELLEAVKGRLGGVAALGSLRTQLLTGRLSIVRYSWLEESLRAAEAVAGPYERATEMNHLLSGLEVPATGNLTSQGVALWPWEAMGVRVKTPIKDEPKSTSARSKGKKRAGEPLPRRRLPRRAGRGRGRGRPNQLASSSDDDKEASAKLPSASHDESIDGSQHHASLSDDDHPASTKSKDVPKQHASTSRRESDEKEPAPKRCRRIVTHSAAKEAAVEAAKGAEAELSDEDWVPGDDRAGRVVDTRKRVLEDDDLADSTEAGEEAARQGTAKRKTARQPGQSGHTDAATFSALDDREGYAAESAAANTAPPQAESGSLLERLLSGEEQGPDWRHSPEEPRGRDWQAGEFGRPCQAEWAATMQPAQPGQGIQQPVAGPNPGQRSQSDEGDQPQSRAMDSKGGVPTSSGDAASVAPSQQLRLSLRERLKQLGLKSVK